MTRHVIEVLEEIGDVNVQLLRAAGVADTQQLLDACCTAAGRRRLASATGLHEGKLFRWTSLADLMRVHGLDPRSAELLKQAGVDTVYTLRAQNPESLVSQMLAAKKKRKLDGRIPSVSIVRTWVRESKAIVARVQR